LASVSVEGDVVVVVDVAAVAAAAGGDYIDTCPRRTDALMEAS
jgi:hypothetical protein